MTEKINKIDHEFGESATLELQFDENQIPLKPVPLKYRYLVVKNAIRRFLNTYTGITVHYEQTANNATAYINFKGLLENNPTKKVKDVEEFAEQLNFKLSGFIQPELRKLLKDDGLDWREYYRSNVYYEYVIQDNLIIVTWSKQGVKDDVRESV